MPLTWRLEVETKGCSVESLPGKDFGGRVDERLIANRIVTDVNLGVASSQVQAAAQLRDGNLPMVDSLDSELIRNRLGRFRYRVPFSVAGQN